MHEEEGNSGWERVQKISEAKPGAVSSDFLGERKADTASGCFRPDWCPGGRALSHRESLCRKHGSFQRGALPRFVPRHPPAEALGKRQRPDGCYLSVPRAGSPQGDGTQHALPPRPGLARGRRRAHPERPQRAAGSCKSCLAISILLMLSASPTAAGFPAQ